MSRSGAARHAANVRWGKEGRVGRNRGISREGEGKSGKSNTPLKAGKNASTSQKVDTVEKAIKKTASKGGSVQTGVKVGKNKLTVDGGHQDYYGAKHATRHFKPGETTPRKTATTIVTGTRAKEGKDILSTGRKSQRAALGNDGKKNIKLITAYKDTRTKKKK